MDRNETNGVPEKFATCESPLCDVRFPQTGMKIRPRRFCSDQCKMDLWAIKRVQKLVEGLPDATVIEILRRTDEKRELSKSR
jgi:hypothetical protein